MSQTTFPVLERPVPAGPVAGRANEATEQPRTPASSSGTPAVSESPRRSTITGTWTQWILLIAFIFIAMESTLMALVMQGRWLILLAPGAVCANKAWEQWKAMKGQ